MEILLLGEEIIMKALKMIIPVIIFSSLFFFFQSVFSVEKSSKKPIWMQVVTVGSKTDGSWSQGLYEGYLDLKRKYPEVRIGWTDSLPFAEHIPVFEQLATSGVDLIYTSDVGYEAVREVAKKFPETWFTIINVTPQHIKAPEFSNNVSSCVVRSEEGGYLCGVAAGLVTKTDKIGYIGGEAYPGSVIKCGVAFCMGVRSVNPKAKIYPVMTGSWIDPQKGYDAAKTLINNGCDVILTFADDCNYGVFNAAKEKGGIYLIGEARDQYEFAPDLMITSRLTPHGDMMEGGLKDFLDGTIKGNSARFFGYREGYEMIAPVTNVPEEVKSKVEAVKEKIKSGEFVVPVVLDYETLESFK